MKANKPDNKLTVVQLTGKVVQKISSKGSKSEHEAIHFETENITYILRRIGENPFYDSYLQNLVGKQIKVTGTINGSIFFATEITVLL